MLNGKKKSKIFDGKLGKRGRDVPKLAKAGNRNGHLGFNFLGAFLSPNYLVLTSLSKTNAVDSEMQFNN